MHLPRVFAVLVIGVATGVSGWAADDPPVVKPLSSADEAFNVRLELLMAEKGQAAGFQMVEKEFARNPQPHVTARYAEFLLQGGVAGTEDRADQGLVLARQALAAGSAYALRPLGLEFVRGQQVDRDREAGIRYLRQFAEMGDADGAEALGAVYFGDIVRRPVDFDEAEKWFIRASNGGKPHALFRLGNAYQHAAEPRVPDMAKACALFYEAAIHGSREAEERLRDLAEKQKDPVALRSHRLVVLWLAASGMDYQTKVVKNAADPLEQESTKDPAALFALGRLHASGRFGYRDMKKAYAFYEQAMALGSDDARAERARLLAEGYGVAKDAKRALAEWQELDAKGNARACAHLGYYCYWGSLDGIAKDAAKAFDYSRRAAALGDLSAQMNLAACYEFGIGVPTDYGLAAKYYRVAASRGVTTAYDKMRRMLPYAK